MRIGGRGRGTGPRNRGILARDIPATKPLDLAGIPPPTADSPDGRQAHQQSGLQCRSRHDSPGNACQELRYCPISHMDMRNKESMQTRARIGKSWRANEKLPVTTQLTSETRHLYIQTNSLDPHSSPDRRVLAGSLESTTHVAQSEIPAFTPINQANKGFFFLPERIFFIPIPSSSIPARIGMETTAQLIRLLDPGDGAAAISNC